MILLPIGAGSGHSTYWGRTSTTARQSARSAPAIYLRASRSPRLWNCRLAQERDGSTMAWAVRYSVDGGRVRSTRSAAVLHSGLQTIPMDSATGREGGQFVPW